MTRPRVSVIVPVYNGAAFLRQALESVLVQTRAASEVIVVDDGSSDASGRIVAEFPAVRYLRKANGGPASARNHGIAAASFEFVAFIDQDDLWHPAKLERQLACFEENPGLDLCYTLVDLFWEPELGAEARAHLDQPRTRGVPGYSTPTLLARRAAFERVGPLDAALWFGDGTDWTMRAMDAGLRVRLLHEVLLLHRMHDDNLTRRRELSKREFVGIVRSHLERRTKAGSREGRG